MVEGVELANEFARSRLTMSEFARQRGVSQRMVQYWSQRARQLAVAASGDLVQVAEVSATGTVAPMAMPPAPPPGASVVATSPALPVPPAPGPPVIEVRLPNGVRIGIGAGFSPQVLAQVIACVGGRTC